MSITAPDFNHGENFSMGEMCIIERDVVVGNDVKIGHRVTLKAGTRIGDRVDIADHCITTGACWIGNDVAIRTGAIISKANIIEDCCFIGPGVVTNHTKHVPHMRDIKHEQLITYIGFGSIIGSQASLLAGLYIGPMTIVGGGAVVVKSIKWGGIYLGCPAVRVADNSDDGITQRFVEGAASFKIKHLMKYMPEINPSPLLKAIP